MSVLPTPQAPPPWLYPHLWGPTQALWAVVSTNRHRLGTLFSPMGSFSNL